jgi:hypothetical protein
MIFMNWFEILKISFKPVDRDRPAPNIKIQPDEAHNATYGFRDDSMTISGNPELTPEQLARSLAHETTHQAQYNTEPELQKLGIETMTNLIEFMSQINDIDINILSNEEFMTIWRELQPEMERTLKKHFELILTLEMQAYIDRDFSDRQFRIDFVNLMIEDIIFRVTQIKNIIGMTDEKFNYVQEILIRVLRPLIDRIAASFVRRERVRQ